MPRDCRRLDRFLGVNSSSLRTASAVTTGADLVFRHLRSLSNIVWEWMAWLKYTLEITDQLEALSGKFFIMGTPADALSFSTKFLQSIDKRIILQNQNGPCPLLAIWNALIIKGELTLPSGAVDSSILQHALVGKIMDMHGNSQDKNLQTQIAETIDLVMKGRFVEGLDVNPQFGSVSGFEFTSEMNVFDLCNVRLLHGWIADKDGGPAMARLAQMSYNSATEIVCTSLADDRMVQNLRSSLSGSQRRYLGSLRCELFQPCNRLSSVAKLS